MWRKVIGSISGRYHGITQLLKSVAIRRNHIQGPWETISMVTFKESGANATFSPGPHTQRLRHAELRTHCLHVSEALSSRTKHILNSSKGEKVPSYKGVGKKQRQNARHKEQLDVSGWQWVFITQAGNPHPSCAYSFQWSIRRKQDTFRPWSLTVMIFNGYLASSWTSY